MSNIHSTPADPTENPDQKSQEEVSYKIGTVSYFNAVPLTWGAPTLAREANINLEIVSDYPSRLVPRLLSGELDATLMPVVEALRNPGLKQISDACISSDGPVSSVKLLSRVSPEHIHTLALDESSRSSATVIKILLKERFQVNPEFYKLEIGAVPENTETDAVLLIGDQALTYQSPTRVFSHILDVGQIWTHWIGLPFTYASWFAKKETETERLSSLLCNLRRNGTQALDIIVAREAAARGLSLDYAYTYLKYRLRYRFAGRERRGVEIFTRMAQKYGLVPLGTLIDFEANRKLGMEQALRGERSE